MRSLIVKGHRNVFRIYINGVAPQRKHDVALQRQSERKIYYRDLLHTIKKYIGPYSSL